MNGSLSASEIAMMRDVFKGHSAVTEVRIFGSRANGTQTLRSDIDFALFGDITPLEGQAIAAELDDLPLPYKFDVQVMNSIQAAPLRDHIQRVGITVYPNLAPQFQTIDNRDSIERIEATFRDLTAGRKDFWETMQAVSSDELRALITLGLNEAKGSYKEVAALFQLRAGEYRRFMDFLRRNNCLIDFSPYRRPPTRVS